MNPAVGEVLPHKLDVLVIRRIAGDAPLAPFLREMAVAQENAVHAGVLLGQSLDRDHLGGYGLGHVVARTKLTGINPLAPDLVLREPTHGALAGLLQGNTADGKKRMARSDSNGRHRVFDFDRDHRPLLIVGKFLGHLAIGAAVSQNKFTLLDVANGLRALSRIDY